MKVFYDTGYPEIVFGQAGKFRINEPKEVPDDLAQALINKGRVKPVIDTPAPARNKTTVAPKEESK